MGRRRIELDRFDLELGGYLRQLRRRRGFTLAEVAAMTGLSHSFLSQVERGRARASFDSLDRIARKLGTSHAEAVTAARRRSASPPPAAYAPDEHGGTEVLTDGDLPFAVLRIRHTDRGEGVMHRHDEPEFVLVVAGAAEVEIDGAAPRILRTGEHIRYPGGVAHRWRAVDEGGFEVVLVKEEPIREPD